MKRTKLTRWALTPSSAIVLGCVALPPPLPPGSDPGNPGASEAPAVAPPLVLRSDPPPPPALQPPAAGSGIQMDHGSMGHEGHGIMQQGQDAEMRHEGDGGMQHDHMHHGASDAGPTLPDDHRQHQGARPATPEGAPDGGSP